MFRLASVALAFGVGFLLPVAHASAQNNRSFVSGQGFDTNNCAITAPCRTFQRAHDVTNAKGEIAVLDTAGYGSVTITKSISIIAPDGIEGGITINGDNQAAITINNQFTDTVTLRGLTISGISGATTGVNFQAGGALIIKNCVVTGHGSTGIGVSAVGPNAGSGITVVITDTVISNNSIGLSFSPFNGSGSLTFERLQLVANNEAFFTSGETGFLVKVAGSDSIIAGNQVGIVANAVSALFDNLKIVNNGDGINTFISSDLILSRSVIYGNTNHGFQADDGAVIETLGDNRILQTNNGGTLTPANPGIK